MLRLFFLFFFVCINITCFLFNSNQQNITLEDFQQTNRKRKENYFAHSHYSAVQCQRAYYATLRMNLCLCVFVFSVLKCMRASYDQCLLCVCALARARENNRTNLKRGFFTFKTLLFLKQGGIYLEIWLFNIKIILNVSVFLYNFDSFVFYEFFLPFFRLELTFLSLLFLCVFVFHLPTITTNIIEILFVFCELFCFAVWVWMILKHCVYLCIRHLFSSSLR